jgi:protein ImuB
MPARRSFRRDDAGDARARCPALATLPCDPAAERQALDHLAWAMLRFTLVVTPPDPPDGLILDVTGCAHLFGGEEALARRVLAATRATTRHAFAGNAMARALARHGADGTGRHPRPARQRARPAR